MVMSSDCGLRPVGVLIGRGIRLTGTFLHPRENGARTDRCWPWPILIYVNHEQIVRRTGDQVKRFSLTRGTARVSSSRRGAVATFSAADFHFPRPRGRDPASFLRHKAIRDDIPWQERNARIFPVHGITTCTAELPSGRYSKTRATFEPFSLPSLRRFDDRRFAFSP